MVSSIGNISSSSVALLFGTSGAASTAPASTASKLLGDVTGNTDDVFKAGNAIGNIIEIASRMKQDAASTEEEKVEVEEINLADGEGRRLNEFNLNPLYGVKGTFTTTHHENGARTEVFVGSYMGMTDEAYRQRWVDSLEADQSTQANKTMLAAFENKTIKETDIADLGFKAELVSTTRYNSDGSATGSVVFDSKSVIPQFREQYTETRDGVMYDKATGKNAAIGQNGNKFIYYTW
jgi:hypothetical protein